MKTVIAAFFPGNVFFDPLLNVRKCCVNNILCDGQRIRRGNIAGGAAALGSCGVSESQAQSLHKGGGVSLEQLAGRFAAVVRGKGAVAGLRKLCEWC